VSPRHTGDSPNADGISLEETPMSGRVLLLVATVVGLLLAAQVPAEAKVVSLGTISRVDLQAACNRAGGESYGIDDPASGFGCRVPERGVISCTSAGSCRLAVGDLVPVTGTSLATVLGYGPSQALAVLPTYNRITEAPRPSRRVHPIEAGLRTSPIVPFTEPAPSPVQKIPN
jgi:hypothetical protein